MKNEKTSIEVINGVTAKVVYVRLESGDWEPVYIEFVNAGKKVGRTFTREVTQNDLNELECS